ncbi:hypothetical protein BDV25DRAFT_74325 [Aspergillus avenaceus]|uniref:BZIP domain-containing protein n=1 Tax=Aspergillus avenaceus TaxID=36643 RepID=A0A5N6TFZ2_ASPAV|nr:hypothetical protein BDV25DRAFT_74325 [Aspergillus avenaceus]
MASPTEITKRSQQRIVPNVDPNLDDWSGMTDAKERRRRQNRVNQRAYRQRKRAEHLRLNIKTEDPSSSTALSISSSSSLASQTQSQSPSTLSHPQPPKSRCPDLTEKDILLTRLSTAAYINYVLGTPDTDNILTLTKMNVFRAFTDIMLRLGMSPKYEWMHDDAISPFSTLLPGYVNPSTLPLTLRPTPAQRSIPHHPWLDFFPHPRMRDNVIRAADQFDDDQLCHDIMGFWDETESCGMVVWGDPCVLENWGVSEGFVKKWPWVLAGCPDILSATNRWRAIRGEKLIFRYL